MGEKRKLLPLALFLSGCAAILDAMPFVFIWLILREMLISPTEFTMAKITPYAWGVGGTAILGVLVYFLALTCSHQAAFRVEVGLQKIGLRRILAMPLGFFDGAESGKIRKIVNDGAGTTHTFLAHQLPDLAGSWLSPLTLLVMIVAVDWKMGLVSLIPVVLGFLVFSTMASKVGKKFMKYYFDSLEEMSNEAVEYVRGVPVVKTFGQTVFSFRRFHDSIINYKEYVIQYTLLWKYRMSFFNVIVQTTAFFLIPVAILLLAHGNSVSLVVADFIFYLIIAPNFMTILMRSAYFKQNAHIAEQALDRVENLLDYQQIENAETPQSVSDYDLEFREVSFRYSGTARNAVDGVSFRIQKGETVALVGPSGGGKTTIARLAARFYDVDSGEVLIGGVDVRKISADELMDTVSFVFQNTRLFSKSLRQNLLMGKENATLEEIEKALDASCSEEIVAGLPAGLDTVIGTEGTYLSGGEQQRISLARAMLKNAPVVLLDEATAFTDPENEGLIQEALRELGRGKTTLIIAHRLSSVQDADRILVIDDGRIVEEGDHRALMEQNGQYCRMYREYEESVNWKLRGNIAAEGGNA